jgi:hypothetical protein
MQGMHNYEVHKIENSGTVHATKVYEIYVTNCFYGFILYNSHLHI